MPELQISVEGTGGAYAEVFRNRRTIEATDIYVETLDRGMSSGAPSIAFIIPLPGLMSSTVVLAQTSLKLFQIAAAATLAKYGDMTGGSLRAYFDASKAELHCSPLAKCPKCEREIMSDSRFCQFCGVRL